MNPVISFRRGLFLLVLAGVAAGCGQSAAPPAAEPPRNLGVSAGQSLPVESAPLGQSYHLDSDQGESPRTESARMADTRWVVVNPEEHADLEMSDVRFRLKFSDGPEGQALADALLGPGQSPREIVGVWRLAADGQEVVFSEIENGEDLAPSKLQRQKSLTASGAVADDTQGAVHPSSSDPLPELTLVDLRPGTIRFQLRQRHLELRRADPSGKLPASNPVETKIPGTATTERKPDSQLQAGFRPGDTTPVAIDN